MGPLLRMPNLTGGRGDVDLYRSYQGDRRGLICVCEHAFPSSFNKDFARRGANESEAATAGAHY